MNQIDKKFIYDFIHGYRLGVLATMNQNNKPEAAVIEFGETPGLEIIFNTLAGSSRKYNNLLKNKSIALAIGGEDDVTVQYEGQAREIKGAEKDKYKQIFFQKTPSAAKWDTDPDIRYFLAIPKWIRYADYDGKPYKIIELKF